MRAFINSAFYVLHIAETSCECTPECSQLKIYNTCTRANHDTSSTNCVNGTTAVDTTTGIETTTTLPKTTTLSSTTTETKEETTTLPITTTPSSFTTTTKDTRTSLQITTTALSSTTTAIKETTTTIARINLTSTLETTDPHETALPTTILTLQTTAEAPYDPITSTKPTTSRPDETNEETSTNRKKNISALDRLGLNKDAFVGVVSGSLLFVYLVVAIVGCACCVFILGRRRNRKRKQKESQENLVPERANHFQNKSYLDSLPQVFHRIDE